MFDVFPASDYHPGMRSILSVLAFLVVLATGAAPLRSQNPVTPATPPKTGARRTVAIGDVHGDYKTFHSLLTSLGLMDAAGHWSGDSQHLIQTGDLLDRGAESRRVLDLLQGLEKEARSLGGRVTVLLGNHELMNLAGDLAYVSPGEFAAFAAEEDPKLRSARRNTVLSLLKGGSPLLFSRYYQRLYRTINERTFDRVFPAGFFAHRQAFSPQGRYGRWLLERPVVYRQGETLFLHGGLSPSYARLSVDEINRRARDGLRAYLQAAGELEERGVFHRALGHSILSELMESERRAGGPHPDLEAAFARVERLSKGPLFSADGPLWYRGLAQANERTFLPQLERILELQGVKRIVVGHTRHKSLAIQGRFGNRVILIDTGMNQKVYGGHPSALILKSDGKLEVFE